MLCIGTFGDICPYAGLAESLKKAGYSVTFATHESFREFITLKDLDYIPIAGDPVEWFNNGELLSLVNASSDFIHWMKRLRGMAGELLEDIYDSCLQACRQADAIIYSPLAWVGYSIAEKLQIQSIVACLQPMTPTTTFPSPWFGANPGLGKTGNLWTHRIIQHFYWHFNRPSINRWRCSSLGLAPLDWRGPYRTELWKSQLFLYGFSNHVVPKPADWPENHCVTGWWFLAEDQKYKPPQEVQEFILSGSSPVYIGFGSMPDTNNEQLLEIIIKALEIAGSRGIVQLGKNVAMPGKITPTILNTGWVNHDWLFPQMAAAVHHGSASTVAQSLQAGIPTVTVPYAWDQPFWGLRIAEIGAGTNPIPRKSLTVNNLAAAIQTALLNTSIKDQCRKLSGLIRMENGTWNAVNIIRRYLGC